MPFLIIRFSFCDKEYAMCAICLNGLNAAVFLNDCNDVTLLDV
jgi:hypothetical protein